MSDADDLDVRTYVLGFRDPGVPSYEGVTFTLQGACDTARREGHRAWLFRHEDGVQLEGLPAVGWADPDGEWRLL